MGEGKEGDTTNFNVDLKSSHKKLLHYSLLNVVNKCDPRSQPSTNQVKNSHSAHAFNSICLFSHKFFFKKIAGKNKERVQTHTPSHLCDT